MATLSGNKVKDTYTSLLKLESNGVTSTLKTIEDGAGTDSALKLSTDTVEVNGTLSFTSAPTTDSSELTALLVDGSNNVVKRELDSSAFTSGAVNAFKTIAISGQSSVVADTSTDTLTLVAGSNVTLTTNASTDTITIASNAQVFANPIYVLRPSSSYTLTTTAATPAQASIDNNSATGSYIINDSSNVHLSTSTTTTGAVTIERNGLIRMDINFVLEVTSQPCNITIDVKRKTSGGVVSTIQSIVRAQTKVANISIGYSLFTHCADDDDIYYEISKDSSGDASLTTGSTFTITKLD